MSYQKTKGDVVAGNNTQPQLQELEQSLFVLDMFINKTYLPILNQLPVASGELAPQKALRSVQINSIQKIVYDKNEDNLQKMKNVFAALSHNNASIITILVGKKDATHIYMGMRNDNQHTTHISQEALKKSLQGNFPGLKMSPVFYKDILSISTEIQEKVEHISAISGVPSLKNENDSFIQGLEKTIEAMQGEEYFAIFIADPVSQERLNFMEQGYQDLYTNLSQLESTQVSLSASESHAVGKSIGSNINKTLSQTFTQNESFAEGSSKTTSESTGSTETNSNTFKILRSPLRWTKSALWDEEFTSSNASSRTRSTSHTQSQTTTHGTAHAKGSSVTKGTQETDSLTTTAQHGHSYQWTRKNRFITSQLESIDEQLQRIRQSKNSGMWDFGVYFLAADKRTAHIGSSLISGLLCGETTGVERRAILHWKEDNGDNNPLNTFTSIRNSLACFQHPKFDTSGELPIKKVSATALISTDELAVGMSLPQKSLPGIPVFESVEFGRAVLTYDATSQKSIPLGKVQHLGTDYLQQVTLDLNSFSSHTFITGSTGAGKSNVVYSLIHNLWKLHNIPFLIIEPAKGEYKNIFGGYRGVSTYGTNINHTPLFRINPFSFPKSVHITEHIDRLIEILNAVWPMYATMPAFLKAAIEITYEKIGWNLISSKNIYGHVFPDFFDLLEVLPELVQRSEYSAEVKGNYIGALVTRIESLTHGYFRSIFTKDELSYEDLFDKPCILDFSRVGSSETKALLMGIVFMKLHEYRLSEASDCNIDLRHITIMEEAHNLLRNTSQAQSMEGANLQGKSVEMMANAIAEMRSYGEGFIIADQAPGLLDPSVIRNTNTKIILRLPDLSDRELVGRAANLNDQQIKELARLRTGCAAIYQNNWQEAVLCQVSKFDIEKRRKFSHSDSDADMFDTRSKAKYTLLKILFYMFSDNLGYQETCEFLKIENPDILYKYFPRLIYELKSEQTVAKIHTEIVGLLQLQKSILFISQTFTDNIGITFHKYIKNIFLDVLSQIPFENSDDAFKKQAMLHIFKEISSQCETLTEKCDREARNIDLWLQEINRHTFQR